MNENKKNDHDCWIQNKRCATGCSFYFVLSRPYAWYILIEVKCDSLRVNFEFTHVTIDIFSSFHDSRSITPYSTAANKCKRSRLVQHMSGTWMVDSLELEHHSRLVQHMIGWVLDSFSNRYIWTSSIYTNDFKHMNGWFTQTGASLTTCSVHDGWVLDCFLEWPQSFDSRITSLFSVQWVTVMMLTNALIVRTINFYSHFFKNTNLETETSLPII